MKRSEIIHIMKDPINKVMDKFKKGELHPTFPSRTIAYTLYLYDKKTINDTTIRDMNNPVGEVDPSTGDFKTFSNIEECLLTWISNGHHEGQTSDFEDRYQSIYKAYNLGRFDKEMLQKKDGNIIDIPEEKRIPNVDQYTIKDSNDNIVAVASTMKDAEDLAKDVNGSTITNSRNKVINGFKRIEGTNMVTTKITSGALVKCSGLNLYYKANDKRPGRSIDGDYYIYDGKLVNGRYAICMKPEFANKVPTAIIGWINDKDIKK